MGGEVQNDDGGEEGGEEAPAENNNAVETPASGKVVANEAVSIRSGASTDSNKVGSAYKGDTFELTGEVDDWYKINYKGQTAYIKAEYCTKK